VDRLETIKADLEKLTKHRHKLPWKLSSTGSMVNHSILAVNNGFKPVGNIFLGHENLAEFIIKAPETITYLISEIERLEDLLKEPDELKEFTKESEEM